MMRALYLETDCVKFSSSSLALSDHLVWCLLFCRVQCVTCCGVIQMTGVAGVFHHGVLVTPLAKIYQKHLITQMALLLLHELINL